MTVPQASVSVLMLHGFGQSGHLFRIKTKPLVAKLRSVLALQYQIEEESIHFVFPDGSIDLRELDRCVRQSEADDCISSDMYAWSRYNEVSESVQYQGLDQSLAKLAELCELHGPFSGVVGFSTGATLASMFASWCESESTPGRWHALQVMCQTIAGHELKGILSKLPQGPLEFAIFCSGFPGTPEYYYAFYEPMISTPTVHIIATWDTMVSRSQSMRLVEFCCNAIVIEHEGMHHVPRGRQVVERIAESISPLWSSSKRRLPSVPIKADLEPSGGEDQIQDESSIVMSLAPGDRLCETWGKQPDTIVHPSYDIASQTEDTTRSDRC